MLKLFCGRMVRIRNRAIDLCALGRNEYRADHCECYKSQQGSKILARGKELRFLIATATAALVVEISNLVMFRLWHPFRVQWVWRILPGVVVASLLDPRLMSVIPSG